MGHGDADFLRAIAAAPHDDTLRLVFADWLEERGDSRAVYLRLEVEAIRYGPAVPAGLLQRLKALEATLDAEWLEQRRGQLWLAKYDRELKIKTLKLIYHATKWRLRQCIDLIEQRPSPWLILDGLPWYELVHQVVGLNQQYPDRITFEARLASAPKDGTP